MKVLFIILLSLMINSNSFAEEDDEDVFFNPRETLSCIYIGVLHGSTDFVYALIIFIPTATVFPSIADVNPYRGCPNDIQSQFTSVILGSVQEECLFRYILLPNAYRLIRHCLTYTRLSRESSESLSRHMANFLTSSCFALCHLINPVPSWLQVFHTFYRGCSLGNLYYRHGLIAVTASHLTHNFLSILLSYFIRNILWRR